MRKYYLEQDEINAFVQVLQLPHVLPIQGPYAIKLLKALAEATKSKYGDSKALNEAAETLTNSYESFVSKLCSLPLDSTKTDVLVESNTSSFSSPLTGAVKDHAPIQPFIFSMKRILVKIIKNFVETTDNSDQTLVNELTDHLLALFAQKKVDLGTATVSRLYSDAIFTYLKHTFQPSADTLDDDAETSTKERSIPDHLKAPLPIEHELIKNERPLSDDGKSVLPFPTPETAQAAYDRAVTIGCVLRSALHDVSAVSGTQTTLVNNETLTTAASTAFSLLCRAALRAKPDSDRVNGYKWDPVLASVRGFDFKDEYRFYRQCWSVETDLTSDLQLECTNRHHAGVEAFLAPALHMIGCSQVAAVGKRAWPAVYHDKSCVNGTAENKKAVVLLLRHNLDTYFSDTSQKPHAFASRPDMIHHPMKKCIISHVFLVDLTTSLDSLVYRIQSNSGSLVTLTKPAIIPRSGAIYLSGMPKCDKCDSNLDSLSDFARSITNQSSFDEYNTLHWVIDVLLHQIDRAKLICNCPDWFSSMVEHPDQHFEPLPDCRAFRAFKPSTDDDGHGYVPGYLGYKPVIIYYHRKNAQKKWHFNVRNEDLSNPGVIHVIHEGTWDHPDTGEKYTCHVTPYYLDVYNHLAISKDFTGPELVKRLLQVVELDRITIKQLMVKYVLHKVPESFLAKPAVADLKKKGSIENVTAFISFLKNYLTSEHGIRASFADKRPLVAVPKYCDDNGVKRNPKWIIGSLAWAFTGQYSHEWEVSNGPNKIGWLNAAKTPLPRYIRPENSQCPIIIKALLEACKGCVSDNDLYIPATKKAHTLATFHLKEMIKAFDGKQNTAITIQTQATDIFSPSEAVLWAHLVFCVMHRIAPLSDLVHHPLLSSHEERKSRLSYVCRYLFDQPKTNAMAHLIHQKLWANDDLTTVFSNSETPKLHATFIFHAERFRYLALAHCVPFIIMRHRFAHENPEFDSPEDGYPQTQIKEIYKKDEKREPKTFLDFFGRHFPALELAAWLMYAGEKVSIEGKHLIAVANDTLCALGFSPKQLGEAEKSASLVNNRAVILENIKQYPGLGGIVSIDDKLMTVLMDHIQNQKYKKTKPEAIQCAIHTCFSAILACKNRLN